VAGALTDPQLSLDALRLFVATRVEDVPCRVYVSVDGTVPGCLVAWDHHVTGETVNLDALPGRIDLHALARERGAAAVEGIGTTSADADAVLSSVAVLLGGPDALDPEVRALLASASHWCDHLEPHPGVDPALDRHGRRLAEWIARELAANPALRFAPTVRDLEARIRSGRPLPEADADPTVDATVARIAREGRLTVVGGVAVVDQRGLRPLPPLRVHELHDRPVTVVCHEHGRGGLRYVVGVNPRVPHPVDLTPALRAVAAAEHAYGPPSLHHEPGPGSENWGGRATAFGSPWNYGSRLTPAEVASCVSVALGLAISNAGR
jgi:hypothetical protein